MSREEETLLTVCLEAEGAEEDGDEPDHEVIFHELAEFFQLVAASVAVDAKSDVKNDGINAKSDDVSVDRVVHFVPVGEHHDGEGDADEDVKDILGHALPPNGGHGAATLAEVAFVVGHGFEDFAPHDGTPDNEGHEERGTDIARGDAAKNGGGSGDKSHRGVAHEDGAFEAEGVEVEEAIEEDDHEKGCPVDEGGDEEGKEGGGDGEFPRKVGGDLAGGQRPLRLINAINFQIEVIVPTIGGGPNEHGGNRGQNDVEPVSILGHIAP